MAKLRNYGSYPDTDSALGRKDYMDDRFSDNAVVTADVTSAINAAKADLALKTYIDQQDALYVAKTYVDTQDATLINANQLGATNGIAQLSAASKVTAPTPLRHRAGVFSVYTTYATERTISSGYEVVAKTVTVPNPGFPWIPMWVGWSMGRWSAGAYCFPGISIRDSSGVWVGRGYGSARNLGEVYPINVVATTDRGQATAYNGQQTFTIYYTREYGSGTVVVGEASSWFGCWVLPAAASMNPAAIT